MAHFGTGILKCLVLAGGLLPAVLAAAPGETLSYRVYYQGLLSAMQELPIAEAQLLTQSADQGRLQVSTLTLSSAAHDAVDAVYPIRYRLRALYDEALGRLFAVERFKRTRRLKHDVAWVDERSGRLRRLRADSSGDAVELPARLRTWLAGSRFVATDKPEPGLAPDGLLDRLTLLQALRKRVPAPGEVLSLPVTDGTKLFRYQWRLEGSESMEVGGRAWPAWRLRVDGFEQAGDGTAPPEPGHAPVYVWISQDARRIPLRLHIDHSVGGFTVAWVPGGAPLVVALDAPVPAAPEWSDGG